MGFLRKVVAVLVLGLVALPVADAGTVSAGIARPHGLKLYINTLQVPIVPINGGGDDYAQLHSKTMLVQATWTGDARGSGYVVRISTSEPKEKVYATCASGTTCGIPKAVPLGIDIETSWYLEVVSTKTHKVVAGYKYCLVRYT